MLVPELWIIAGPNGAGKTTCVQREPIANLLPGVSFLNPDERTLAKLHLNGYRGFVDAPIDVQNRFFIESADETFAELKSAISQRMPIGVETVLSSDKYRPLVDLVRSAHGFVGLIYIALSSPDLAKRRVADRVRRGGHGIPEDKIESRWHRSLGQLAWFATRATAFWVLDNSDSDPVRSTELLACGKLGFLDYLSDSAFPEMRVALAGMRSI